ncbi:MAG: peptidylprolyl isomerase [Candidatus Marinimicrobia bacterium]|nr:peptidylprolyl isomerase [Candidatus Neomarinimicrobiota bacterium]MCF7850158.1 peptidylprolyl isomerase [Candidatus Neomarinimicrobiota bacterium]
MTEKNLKPRVIMETELGKIVFKIDLENAPVTARNFLRYVDEDRFQGTSFYRVVRQDNQAENDIKIEVIQGGYGTDDNPLQLQPIAHESTAVTGILHENGTLSMARAEIGTASSEFFICIGAQHELDYMGKRNPDGYGFAAFGHVVKGMHVVKKIQQQAADGQMLKQPVKILSVKRRGFLKRLF